MTNNNSNQDYRLRPYSSGIIPHDLSLATIIVYTDSNNNLVNQAHSLVTNYLTNLVTRISSLTPEQDTNVAIQIGSNGDEIALLSLENNNKTPFYGVFNNFSITDIAESKSEIVKVGMNLSSDWNAFFFGEQPTVYRFNGHFIDTADYPYYQEFLMAYDKYLAGRKCVENHIMTKFMYDGKIVNGLMLNISISSAAGTPHLKMFSFSVLVIKEEWIRINIVPSTDSQIGQDHFYMENRMNGLTNIHRISSDLGLSARTSDTIGTTSSQPDPSAFLPESQIGSG